MGLFDPTEAFRAHGLDAAPAANPHVGAALLDSAVRLDITHGGCSCRIYGRAAEHGAFDVEADRTRYTRKGWSAAKADRAVASKQVAQGRRSVTPQADPFCASVEALVWAGSHVAVISHNYTGPFADEMVSVDARARLPLQTLRDTGGVCPEDTLVTIEGESCVAGHADSEDENVRTCPVCTAVMSSVLLPTCTAAFHDYSMSLAGVPALACSETCHGQLLP